MNYEIILSNQFKRSYKKCIKRGLDKTLFEKVVTLLARDGELPQTYKPHKLRGRYTGCWECHISPDWLLVWQQNDKELTLLLVDTGSHADLFG